MSDGPSLQSSDFEKVVVRVSLYNITTDTEVTDGRQYIGEQLQKNQIDATIDLIEFSQDGMAIEVPSRSGAVGHQLKLKIQTEGAAPMLEVSAMVSVRTIEKLSPSRDRLDLGFNEHDPKAWHDFQKIFEQRQKQIDDFLTAAKGH